MTEYTLPLAVGMGGYHLPTMWGHSTIVVYCAAKPQARSGTRGPDLKPEAWPEMMRLSLRMRCY